MRDLGGSRASQRPRHSARPSDERASPTRAIELGPYRDYFRRVSLHVTPGTQSWSGHSVLYDIFTCKPQQADSLVFSCKLRSAGIQHAHAVSMQDDTAGCAV